MKRLSPIIACVFFFASALLAQQPVKLVLVISIDQFPYEYIPKYRSHFTKGGFNYLLNNGANFVDCRYLHASTKTGPGHAVIMSGSYGNLNGIIDNDWIDRTTNLPVYCVEDRNARLIGISGGEGRSPKNLIGTTLGDQLNIHTFFQSKVISVSNKDRSAILMGGKLADAAYWSMDSLFVTSSYYRQSVPRWVHLFNKSGRMRSYFGKKWNLLLADHEYGKYGIDQGIGELDYFGRGTRFPRVLDGGDPQKLTNAYFFDLLTSPYGVEILMQFAQDAIKAERLGQRGVTDLFCLGISSTDYVGHAFGPQSWEVMDLAIRIDGLLEEFFSFLHSTIGLQNCFVILTSDHGIAPIPEALKQAHPDMDAGRISQQELVEPAEKILERSYGRLTSTTSWIQGVKGGIIYLDDRTLSEKGIRGEYAASVIKEELSKLPFVAAAFTAAELSGNAASGDLAEASRLSFHPQRSGDIIVLPKPYYFFYDPQYPSGTAHGTPYSYDTHVPLLLAGPGINPGTYYNQVSPADIAPTVAALLGIEMPPQTQGRILSEALQ